MFYVDDIKCTGCGLCISQCPQQAITVDNHTAVINQESCNQCGDCVQICPEGAINKMVPAYIQSGEGGDYMFYGYGRGSGGRGGAGFGFRGGPTSGPFIGRGRGGLPRCWQPGFRGVPVYQELVPYWPAPTPQDELGFYKDQAEVIRRQLEEIEQRIQELEKKE